MERSATRTRLSNAENGARDAMSGVPPRRGALVIAVAVVVALVVWALVRLLGVDLVASRGGETAPVTVVDVLVATIVAGMAAWAVNAMLRRGGRLRWWPFVGSTALAISVIGPSWLADGASAVALICMHVAVGAVLIAGLHGVLLASGPTTRR
jgi:hypothetical protein